MVAETMPRAATRGGRAHTGEVSQHFIELRDVTKAYATPAGDSVVLDSVNLVLNQRDFVAIVGKSGSGKSTLVNIITGIDHPTSGDVVVDDTVIHELDEEPLTAWRGREVGIVFQFFQLLPTLTCLENVMLPMDFCGMYSSSERADRARYLLAQVEMEMHADKLPSEISGGEQQRVAIARALSTDPPLIVADEPTGNLDAMTADAVFTLFEELVADDKTILVVTHDAELAGRAERTVSLLNGTIEERLP